MRDLILAHIWLLDLCSYKSGVTGGARTRGPGGGPRQARAWHRRAEDCGRSSPHPELRPHRHELPVGPPAHPPNPKNRLLVCCSNPPATIWWRTSCDNWSKLRGFSAKSRLMRTVLFEDLWVRVYVISCELCCWLVNSIENCRKFQKIAKPVLLETRCWALQLLLSKFDMKLNIFESMLNPR
jgi:hypothetical protein